MNFQFSSLPCAIMALLSWPSFLALSAPPSLNNVPGDVQVLKFSGDPVLKKLKTFLEQKDLVRFYQTVHPYAGQLDWSSMEETVPRDKLDKLLLIDRLAASAPLFELNNDTPFEQLTLDCVMKRDISLKESVMKDLYIISKINLKQNKPSARKREVGQLCSLYVAMMIQMMKDHYIPDIREKNQKIKERRMTAWKEAFFTKWEEFYKERDREMNKGWKESLEPKSKEEQARYDALVEKCKQFEIAVRQEEAKRRNWAHVLGIMEERNSSMKSFLRDREKTLLLILLDNYPGKSSEVFKYFKLAGYSEDEIMKVIDQVEGRNKNTEFLYKSSLGKKFLKDKKEQDKYPTESAD